MALVTCLAGLFLGRPSDEPAEAALVRQSLSLDRVLAASAGQLVLAFLPAPEAESDMTRAADVRDRLKGALAFFIMRRPGGWC